MITLETLEKFRRYLELVESKLLNKYFEAQKEYICCKEGCANCCKTGEFPTSELELMYLMAGFQELNENLQKEIANNADNIKAKRDANGNRLYQCPFLIDNRCAVYKNRMLICRTHGLMYYVQMENGEKRNKIPACSGEGLNYSQVYDVETKTITEEAWKNSGINAEPVAYNISREALMDENITKDFGLEFGESKALIDWF